MKQTISSISMAVLVLAISLLGVGKAGAHAFLDHADPRVGATLAASVEHVRIWFDSALEPAFSKITVQDAAGKVVDRRDARVNPSDATLLEVGVPRLPPGTYRVIWSVVARDGHRTTGDYMFVIK